MQDSDRLKLNRTQIEAHLKSAVDTLTPNVFDQIDLSTPQETAVPGVVIPGEQSGRMVAMNRRLRGMALAAAACLCLIVTGGSGFYVHNQNQRVEAVIGIDVNPSIELTINRKNKVLTVQALNQDGEAVLEDMDLKGTDLNVAVHAIVGSMVTHGYLDQLDNAILVTVSNDSISKASELRTSIVDDIEVTLEENQVQAVVYDQQVIERDEIKNLAEQYGISYGKAYFLKELIDQNTALSMADMELLSSMTMEEIAQKIAQQSYALGNFAEQKAESSAAATTPSETTLPAPTTEPETTAETLPETLPVETTEPRETTPAETTTAAATTAAETEPIRKDRVQIDYVDYEDGSIYVYFVTKVKWKHPTVSVFDEEGESYSAMVTDTSGTDCVIAVQGLEGGKSYTFVLGGLLPMEGGGATTVTGYFEKPVIANEAGTEEDDDDDDETEEMSTAPETQNETDPVASTETAETTKAIPAESAAEPVAVTAEAATSGVRDQRSDNSQGSGNQGNGSQGNSSLKGNVES